MTFPKLQNKIFRVICFLLVVIVIVVIAAYVSIPLYFNDKIKHQLEAEVAKQTKGEYVLQIKDLRVDVLTQSILLKDCRLIPVKDIKPNSAKYIVSVKHINLKDFGIWKFLSDKELVIDELEILQPTANIYRNIANKQATPNDTTKKASLYSMLSKSIHGLTIDDIHITNADISMYDNLNDKLPTLSTKNNELHISNFQINEKSEKEKQLFLSDDLQLIVKEFLYKASNNLNTFSIKKMMASYNDSTLVIDSMQLIPNYNKQQYAKKLGHQTDRIVIGIDQLAFSDIDLRSLLEKNILIAKQLKVKKFELEAYRNMNDPSLPPKLATSLQQKLKNIPILMNIERVLVSKSLVVYEEVAKGADAAGSISFNNLNGTITDLTTNPSMFGKKKLDIKASAMFMNNAKLDAHYVFPLNTDKMVFDCYGKLGEMDLTVLNKILTPNAHLAIKNGKVDSAVISFHADEIGALGTVRAGYHDLRIDILKMNNRSGLYTGALSLLFRIIFIKKDNPKKNRDFRMADINYKRNPQQFIFKYTWQSILSGIKPTIGMPQQKMKNKVKMKNKK